MSIVSWERRPDGGINVWDSPVRWAGRKRVVKDPDVFFEKVKALSPFAVCGLVQGGYGFCADPGIFTSSHSFLEKNVNELEKNIVAMIADWRPVHLNAAKDAMMDIAPDDYEYNQNMSTWVMKYLKYVSELDHESAIDAHAVINNPDTGYQALTRKHRAAALRRLLEYGVSHVLKGCDFLRVVESLHVGSAFKVELETMVETLNAYIELRCDLGYCIQSRAADRRGLKVDMNKRKQMESALRKTKAYKLVSGRHPRLGRHGCIYAQSIRGVEKEADRVLVLTCLVRERFADVIDVLGVDQVLNDTALD